jgi:ABC-2 type transport system ATP-binding protein
MPALSIRSLRKSFLIGPTDYPQRRIALDGVDLEVSEGEIVGLVGAGAAGKTSLLLCAAGMLRRDSGSVYWFGERFGGGGCLPGLVYVSPVLTYYPFLTVRDVLTHHVLCDGPAGARRKALVERLACALHLARHLSSAIKDLDLQTLKRVAIAGAFAEDPRVVLFDSTLDGLGAGAVVAHRIICEAAAAGVTVIAASREVGTLAPVATRFVVMESGRVSGSFTAERSRVEHYFGQVELSELTAGDGGTLIPLRQIAERIH